MAVKTIFKLGDPRLYDKSQPVRQDEVADLRAVVEDLHDTLLDYRAMHKAGRAIAASQIGVMKRVIYLNTGQPQVLINPELAFPDAEMMEIWDDCMCFPELLVKVKRFKTCEIKYKDMEWNDRAMVLSDNLSELIQHEYDHLDGVLAVDRAIDSRSFALKPVPDSGPRRIGIVGGISHESTIKLYEHIHSLYYSLKKDYYYPEVLIYSLNFQRFTDYENSGNKQQYIGEILKGVRGLEAGGADFVIFAANSPHSVFDEVEKQAKVPMLSIVKEVARHCRKAELNKLLLLGIKHTMQSDFYQRRFAEEGLAIVTPSEAEQDIINRIIFDELVLGIFKQQSKEVILKIMKNYQVDGVILGCTELPLFIKQGDTEVPLIDTLAIHSEAAVRYALKL